MSKVPRSKVQRHRFFMMTAEATFAPMLAHGGQISLMCNEDAAAQDGAEAFVVRGPTVAASAGCDTSLEE
jgi:hypothetical protein